MFEIFGLMVLVGGVVALWWALAPDKESRGATGGADTPGWVASEAAKEMALASLKSGFQTRSKNGASVQKHGGKVDLGQDPSRIADQAAPDLHKARLEMGAMTRLLKPAAESMGQVFKRVTPVGYVDRWESKIALAGLQGQYTVSTVLSMQAIGSVVGFAVGLFAFTYLGGLRGMLAGGMCLWVGVTYAGTKVSKTIQARQLAIEQTLPDALDQMSVCVEAGLGFDAALLRAARGTGGPLGEEFGRTLQDIRLGAARGEALRALLERSNVAELRMFVRSLIQAEKTGVPIAKVLRTQAEDAREKRRQRAEEKAMKLPVKLIFPLMLCILPSLFIVILGPAVMQLMDSGGVLGTG